VTSERTEQDIICVETYLIDEHDVCVDFDEKGTDEFWFDPDRPDDCGLISIDNTNPPLTQLIILLHEAGHVIFRHKNNKPRAKIDRQSIEGKVEILIEEMSAWHEGYKLSKKFGIVIDPNLWEHNCSSSLAKYIKWALIGEKDDEE